MLSEEFQKSLQTTSLFKYLEPFEVELLLKHGQQMTFPAGKAILQQGKMSLGIYIIIKGKILVNAKILGEATANLGIHKPGSILGEINLLEKLVSPVSAIAESEVESLFISDLFFSMLSEFYQMTKYKLLKGILEQTFQQIDYIHNKITKYMTDSNMMTRPIFSEVIKTWYRPSTTDLESIHIEKKILLDKIFCNCFTESELDILLENTTFLKITKKCTLIEEKERNPDFYFVIRGAVQCSIIENNIVAKLAVLGPGKFFGAISILQKENNSLVNFTTYEQAIILKITEKNLMRIQEINTKLWSKIYDLMFHSIICLEKNMVALDVRLNVELYNR